jgi:hypothetical protein
MKFYKSPLGKKVIEKTPELMQKSMAQTQALYQKRMPEFLKRMEKASEDLLATYKK